MGDAQSAQRESRSDAAEEEEDEEGRTVDDARLDAKTEDEPLKKSGEFAEINGKTDSIITEVNHDCEDEIAADAILSPDKGVSETARQLQEEGTTLENVEINDKEPPNDADANEDVPLKMTEMDEKQNDINDGFKRFFSNIGLKLTVKKGSGVKDEITTDETNIEDTAKEPQSANNEQNIDLSAQEAIDNDSTACPAMKDVTSDDILENEEEKTPEAEEEVEPDNVDTATSSPVVEDDKAQQDAIEEDLSPESTSSPEAEEAVSPVKRFFTTGIFSGLRKKKKATGDESTEKELVDIGGKETEIQQEVQQDVETATVDTKHKENGRKEEILSAASDQTLDVGKSPSTNPVTIIINEPEITSAPDKVQDSPLKWLLSGSNLKKLSKKQRVRKSSNTTLSDSEEPFSDQLVSPTSSAETQKEESLALQLAEATGEEEGAWASFKKLVTPKKQMKKSSLTNEEPQIPGSEEENKPSEREQISDHSTEEKKRKDSSVSWEAVLCRSGRRRSRSRKTSDSEDESPQVENDNKKQELTLESSNKADETLTMSPRKPGSPEGDVGSPWKSFKKLVTPKRKTKDEEESKDNNTQSDSEVTQEESSFSIKKLLPGRKKKKKSAENQDQVSSDEADKEVASCDEDSDTPAVIPLSEFDTIETTVQVDVESHVTKEADHQLQQDPHDQMAEPVLPCDTVQTETKKVQDSKDTTKEMVPTTLVSNAEPEDLTEISSEHQLLSDIPEEGFITETNVSEEAARDDTIAEDLIEITSEAITAPEPADITLEDDTEMISAVSQLSASSNTSGDTTPVPVDYDVKHTEALLHQVVETISISPDVVPVGLDEVNSERIVGSVSHQILETFVKEKPTILEIHRKSNAISINKGLTVEKLDTIDEPTATPQTERICEVNKPLSTEIVSEVPKEEAVTDEIAVDEVYQANISHPEESIKELEVTEDSQHLVKGQPEAYEAGSTETLPEGEAIVAVQGSLIGAHLEEKEPIAINSKEAEFPATVADEDKDGGAEEEAQTLTPLSALHSITDQVQVKNKDQEVKKLRELPAVQIVNYDSEDGSRQLPENKAISEVIPAEETVTDKPKEETEPVMEHTVEAEIENKLQGNDAPTERAEEPEVLEAGPIAILDSEDGSAKALEKDVVSEVTPAEETAIDKPEEETDPITECKVEAENENIPQADAAKTEHVEEPEMSEAAQTAKSDSVEGSAHLLEKEVISEVIPAEETVTDKPKEETVPVIEHTVEAEMENEPQADDAQTKHAEEPEVLEAGQIAILDLEAGSAKALEKDVVSEVTPTEETAIDKPEEEIHPLNEYKVEAESKNIPQADSAKTEHVEEPEVLEAAQTATSDSVEGSDHLLEKEMISDVIPAEATVTDKSKEETVPVMEHTVEAEMENEPQADDAQTKHADEPEVLEAGQIAILDLKAGSAKALEKDVVSEVNAAEETAIDKPEEETDPITKCKIEAENGTKLQADSAPTELVKEPEVLEAAQTATSDSMEGDAHLLEKEVISEVISAEETSTDKPKEETEPVTEYNVEAENESKLKVDAAQTEHADEPEVLQAGPIAILDSEDGSAKALEKDVVSEVTPAEETAIDKPEEETDPLNECKVEAENENIPQADSAKTEHVEEPEVLEAAQTATSDSVEGDAHLLEKEMISDVIPAEETATDKPKEETEPVTEYNVEAENESKLQIDAAQTEHADQSEAAQTSTFDSEDVRVQLFEKEVITEVIPAEETVSDKPNEEPKVLEAVQVAPLDIEKNGVRSPQGEISENILAVETVTYETKPATENLVGASSEPEHQEMKTDTPKNDHHQVAEVLGTVQVPTSESEEGSVTSETTIDAETVTDKPNEETVSLHEVGEAVDALITEHVQEPEAFEDAQNPEEGSSQPLEKKVVSEEIPPADELTPELSAEEATTGHDPADVKDMATETEAEVEAPMPAHVVTQSIAVKLEKKVLLEYVPNPDTKQATASVTGETETETRVVAELSQTLKGNEVQEIESTLQDVQVGNEEQNPEVAEELQTLAVLHVPSVNDEAISLQVREITVFSEVDPATCVENAAAAHEPLHKVHLSAVESSVGEERWEIPGFEITSSAVEHAVVAQVIACCLKDVAAAIPDALIETKSDSQEPLIDSMANEQEFKETSETTTPLEKIYVTKRGEESSPVMMMNVPSVQSKDNHRIQVQVVDVDIKSAKMIVDPALEVGVTEAKEVMEVCGETVEEVDVLSTTSETEETLINEGNKVTIQEVIQHVKENLPETAPESAPADLEQEVLKEMDAVTEPSEITKSEVEDNFVTCREGQEEKQAVKCEASTTGQQVFKDLMETPICDTPGRPGISIHDPKGDLEEPKVEVEESEARVTTEEVKLLPDVKRISEKAQTLQIAQSLVVTPNTGLIVPQNTGMISSIGNVESPSSLSLEFKLIRFGHTKEPASPPEPPTTERVEPVKQTDVAEVGIQSGEPKEEIHPTQRAGRQNQESTEVTQPASVASTEREMIMNPPLLLDVRMQTVEPAEQMKSPGRGTTNVQAAETIHTVRQGEKKDVSPSPTTLCEVCDHELRAEVPLKHMEEENEQDVWMDAEEDIYSQGMFLHEVVEEEEEGVQHEFEVAPDSTIEEGEGQQGVLEKGGACETESGGENFAVALEEPAIAAASVTAIEWD